MFSRTFALLTLLGLVLTAGCAGSGALYDWGRYERSVQALVVTGGSSGDRTGDLTLLAEEIRETVAMDRRVPPGKHAHLGYLYVLAGQPEAARRHFVAEKMLFPESTPFMDRLLERVE